MRVALADLEVEVEEHGAGAPLVLVHGLGGSSRTWQKLMGDLAADLRIIAYDLRGAGRSGTPPGPYSLALLVADLHGLVEKLGLEQVTLVGHSLGGAVVLAYAAAHPERVSVAVGVSAPSVTPAEQRAALAERAAQAMREGMSAMAELHALTALPEAFRVTSPDDTADYMKVIAAGHPTGYATLCGVIADLDLTRELERIDAPVLLVHGELDRIVPAQAARDTARAIRVCDVVELAGCGHVVPFERPRELATLVRRFVTRHAAS